MLKKKYLLSLLCLCIFQTSFFAQERDVAHEKRFLVEIGKESFPSEILNIINNDKKYNLAILQLTNQDYMKVNEVITGDPHKPNEQKKDTIKTPDFKEVYKNLVESYSETKNPVSAYILTNLISTAFGKNNKLSDFAKFSEVNYKNGLCSGFIDYGETLQNGYFIPVNKEKALFVYKEGYEKCKDISWFGSLLTSKIQSIRKSK